MGSKVTVRDVWNQFHYTQITGNDSSLDRQIKDSNTNRPGLELSGFLDEHVLQRVVVIGDKENNYIKTMSRERQEMVFDYLTSEQIPMIIISRDMACPPILKEIAEKKNFPIFSSPNKTNSLIIELLSFLEVYFAPIESVHGVLLQVYGKGVLIRGESGIGKSEIALELIRKGHILVADDRVDITRIHNNVVGKVPPVLRNMLEIRGVGIIDVTSMYGVTASTDEAQVDFIIDLKKWDDEKEYDRVGIDSQRTETIFGVDVPRIIIPVSEGRSIAVIIEAAVTDLILRSKGIDSAKMFDQRIIDLINKQKEGD